eukprot:CAMPEP_0118811978 /NCGR_PEP_ID=MMETSP1162-20130426/2017_1 /TAXON_ID=33656 /ORGANISM="Phaeocystis Sp, Strain CCMP2710" /LENGTH=143 /DNA_ID=CAMNT_0006741665 /DNA_START=82 /DNA_END=509 /DNA_ORIENTATION=-
MDNDEQKPPVSPTSPISLPASMELSQNSPMSLPAPLPVEPELLGVGKEATAAELFERAEAQRIAEAPGARLLAEAQGSGASLNRLLRRLAIGVALLGILGTLWLLREQTVTVVEMLAEYVRSAGAWGVAGFMATFVVYGVLLL